MKTNEILKSLRQKEGITQAEAAERLGVSLSSYQKYERDKGSIMPSLDVLMKIADLYKVTIDYLVDREPPENTPNPLDSLGLNSLDKAIVQAYIALKPAERTQLVELLTKIADGAKPEITLIEPEQKRLPHSATIRERLEEISEDEAKNGA